MATMHQLASASSSFCCARPSSLARSASSRSAGPSGRQQVSPSASIGSVITDFSKAEAFKKHEGAARAGGDVAGWLDGQGALRFPHPQNPRGGRGDNACLGLIRPFFPFLLLSISRLRLRPVPGRAHVGARREADGALAGGPRCSAGRPEPSNEPPLRPRNRRRRRGGGKRPPGGRSLFSGFCRCRRAAPSCPSPARPVEPSIQPHPTSVRLPHRSLPTLMDVRFLAGSDAHASRRTRRTTRRGGGSCRSSGSASGRCATSSRRAVHARWRLGRAASWERGSRSGGRGRE